MSARLSLAITVAIVLGGRQTAGASPITYDFTGTFNGNGNVNGSNQISGSFTINADQTVTAGTSSVTESGNDVSITVNAGGHVYNFINTAQDPTAATFTAVSWPIGSNPNPTNQSLIEYEWYASTPSVNPTLVYGMSFYDAGGGTELLSNMRSFNYNLVTSSFNFSASVLGSTQGGEGTITSITLVSTPEPSTLAVFVVLGMIAIARRKRRS